MKFWEKCIGIGTCTFHLRQIDFVGKLQGLLVDAAASDDKDHIVLACIQCLFDGRENFTILQLDILMTDDDVSPVGKCSMGERLKSLSAHQYGMTCGEGAKSLHVFRDMKEQLVLIADGIVGIHTGDDVDFHITKL